MTKSNRCRQRGNNNVALVHCCSIQDEDENERVIIPSTQRMDEVVIEINQKIDSEIEDYYDLENELEIKIINLTEDTYFDEKMFKYCLSNSLKSTAKTIKIINNDLIN